MTTRTTLCLVRHGETDWNAAKRLQGHLNVGLNANGEEQARATARLLSSHRFAAVFTSDLDRARSTATIITGDTKPLPVIHPGLRERHYGLFQGLTYEDAHRQHPDAYARFEARDPTFAFPDGGESLHDFRQRVVTTLDQIVAQHPGTSVLVVTHGGVLDIVHRLVTGKPLFSPRDFLIPNAALNWITHDDSKGWELQSWAETTHLASTRDELPAT